MHRVGKLLNRYAVGLLIGWVVILSILYSALSLVRHTHFQSGGFDLGLYDQAVWQYSQGIWPYNTIKDRFILGDHLTLTLPLLAPLFLLYNQVASLLVFQAVWISASSLAMYGIARGRQFSGFQSFVVAALYSLFYGIQYAVFFDFHPVVFGVGLLVWLAYFWETQRQKWFLVTLILLLLTQENMGIALASLGFVYVFTPRYRAIAVICIVGGMLVSVASSKVITLFSPIGFQYWPQIFHNPLTILRQLFDASEKRQVWLYTMSWYAFLPLLSPGAMLGVLLDVAQYFVTGPDFARMWSPFMHHRIVLAPLVTLGALDGLVWLRSKHIHVSIVIGIVALLALGQQFLFHEPLNKLTKRAYWQNESWMADNEKLLALVPVSAGVATQQNLIPHLSHRKEIYLVWPRLHDFDEKPCGQTSCWWLDFGGRPDYLVIDVHPNQWLTQLLESPEHVQSALANMQALGKITLVQSVGEARLYKIRYDSIY